MEPIFPFSYESKIGIAYDPQFSKHLTSSSHNESTLRCQKVVELLKKEHLLTALNHIKSRVATIEELELAHDRDYIKLVETESQKCRPNEIRVFLTSDTEISNDSFFVARIAVGSILECIDAVFNKQFQSTFAVVRPPGHHATRNMGMGFCLFNNVAIGAKYALMKKLAKTVLIVDFDVHHGNGTEEICKDDSRIFYFSTHLCPLYPGTASHKISNEHLQDHPISAKNPKSQIYEAFDELKIAMKNFRPELVMISAGFDGHQNDPIGGKMKLTEEDFKNMTIRVKEIANMYAEGRIVSALEGGYNLESLAKSCLSHVKALISY
jgi:acetoin utilization deacetylase AcuC-like enzyme